MAGLTRSVVMLAPLFLQVGLAQSSTEAFDHHGLGRSYVLHLPKVSDANAPRLVSVALHNAGSNGSDCKTRTGFSRWADRERFVAAYPGNNHPTTNDEPGAERIVWTPMADLLLPLSPGSAFALEGRICVLGGRQNAAQQDVDSMLEYDPETNRWSNRKTLPFKSHLHATTSLDGKVYLISSDMQQNRVYDLHADSSEPIAPNPDKRIPGPCVALGGKIYVIGGIHKIIFDLSDRIDVYDPKTNRWSQRKPMPHLRLGLCVPIEGKVLVIGGWEPVPGERRVHTSSAVQLYDPVTEEWDERQDLPFGVVGSAMVLGSKVYVMGCGTGEIPGQTGDLTTVLVYDIARDLWRTTTPLPRLAVGAGFAVLDKSIYLIGGCAGQQHGWTDYASTYRGDIVRTKED
jgi:hypothetical protein